MERVVSATMAAEDVVPIVVAILFDVDGAKAVLSCAALSGRQSHEEKHTSYTSALRANAPRLFTSHHALGMQRSTSSRVQRRACRT